MTMQERDEVVTLKGFRVEIAPEDGGPVIVDADWETCTGGALNLEFAEPGVSPTDPAVGSDRTSITTPGHKFVDEITLRGPMTKSRKWIGQNINDTVKGKFTRFDLTIIEINRDGSDGKRFNYTKCFLTRYCYPVLSADGTGNLYEEVSLKPERLNLQ